MTRALTEGEKKNFQTLLDAAGNDDVALISTELKVTIEPQTVAVVAAIVQVDGEYQISPFAMLIPGDPFEMLEAPA